MPGSSRLLLATLVSRIVVRLTVRDRTKTGVMLVLAGLPAAAVAQCRGDVNSWVIPTGVWTTDVHATLALAATFAVSLLVAAFACAEHTVCHFLLPWEQVGQGASQMIDHIDRVSRNRGQPYYIIIYKYKCQLYLNKYHIYASI